MKKLVSSLITYGVAITHLVVVSIIFMVLSCNINPHLNNICEQKVESTLKISALATPELQVSQKKISNTPD